MIANAKDLYRLIDKILIPRGYIRKKDTYYIRMPDCICFLAIVKSPFAGRYDDLMGCILKDIYKEDRDYPKYYENDLKFGLGDLFDKDVVKKALDLENNEFGKDQREAVIRNLIEVYAIPFLEMIGTKKGITQAIKEFPDLQYFVSIDLKKALGLPYEE